jgi:hypothetical protein
MGSTRATLIGGAANYSHAGYTSALSDDGKFDLEGEWQDIQSAMYGVVDQIESDLLVKISGTPLTFTLATTPGALYPYLTPSFGSILPSGADTPFVYNAAGGDVYTAICAVLTKMPDITLGVTDSALGSAEWTGIIGNGMDPETAYSYYQIQTAQTYTPLAIDRTKIPRGHYAATWNTLAFEPEDKLTISFETTVEPVKVQGRTRGFKLTKLAVMAKTTPIGLTAAQIDTAAMLQGAGATHGRRLSASAHDLAITGPMNITQKNAAIKTAGFRFGNSVLRIGEIGFYSTIDPTTVPIGAILSFS